MVLVVTKRGSRRQAKVRLIRTLDRSGFTPRQISSIARVSPSEVEQALLGARKVRRTLSHRAYWGQHQEDRDEDFHLADFHANELN